MKGPALLVHGGASAPDPTEYGQRQAAVDRSLEVGWTHIDRGALGAAVAAVMALEDEPILNAGVGACFNRDGYIELDAGVMEGADLRVGAIGAVRDVRHPVKLALTVLEQGPHVLMVGDGASRYAREHGLEICPPDTFETDAQRASLRQVLSAGDTVGAVARDVRGHVAAAVSTGGLAGKLPGRLGDAPVPGAGFYAIDGVGAACGTGHGESFMRLALCYRIVAAMELGRPAELAARDAIQRLADVMGATGGVIVVGDAGEPAAAFNTPFMPLASRVG